MTERKDLIKKKRHKEKIIEVKRIGRNKDRRGKKRCK